MLSPAMSLALLTLLAQPGHAQHAAGGGSQTGEAQALCQILCGARRNTEALQSGSAWVSVDTRMAHITGVRYLPPGHTETRWLFSGGMHRYDHLRIGRSRRRIAEVYTYDGRRTAGYTPATRDGYIRRSDDLAFAQDDPRQFGFYYSASITIPEAIAAAQRRGRLRLCGVRAGPHGRTYTVELTTPDNLVERLYLDSSIGYLIKRREIFATRDNAKRLIGVNQILECAPFAHGCWFPTHILNRGFTQRGQVWALLEARVREFRPNIRIGRGAFRIRFPIGTRITDDRTGRVYLASTPWLSFRRSILALVLLCAAAALRGWRRRRPIAQIAAAIAGPEGEAHA